MFTCLWLGWAFAIPNGEAAVADKKSAPTPFEAMDRHALAAPASVAGTPARLAAYLTGPAANPWEKTRAIFRWITQFIEYDAESLWAGRVASSDPEVVLTTRRAVCAGYARLFVRLCEEAGIEAEYVTGQSREYSPEVSERLSRLFGRQIGHAWNAVKLGGRWHLLDATWGAGHIDDQLAFVREFDPHYFLTRPEEFIHTHFPEDPKWQLLARPIERSVYDQLVHVRSGFFRHGLTLQSHRLLNIAASGPLKVTVGATENVVMFATVEKDGPATRPASTLAQRQGGVYEIHACFPEPGLYRLRIFSQRRGQERSDRLQWALGYQVRVVPAARDCAGLPETFRSFQDHDVYLTAPMADRLSSRAPQQFQLSVPRAEKVYVKAGSELHYLQGRDHQFRGRIAAPPGELFLFAEFPGDEKAWGLLKYVVE